MIKRFFATALLLAAAPFAVATASAQSKNATVLPLWNSNTGKVEALLLLEPQGTGRWQMGANSLESSLGLSGRDTLGMVCKNSAATSAISNLSGNCVLAAIDGDGRRGSNGFTGVSLTRNSGSGRIGVTAGGGTSSLPSWLASSRSTRNSSINQNSLTIFGTRNIGREATISIGGTVARARLVPANDVPALADRWDMQTLSVGAGYGNFSASIVGRVIETPNKADFSNVGVGINWRAPWKGEFSIGADNVMTRGKNPFGPNEIKEEGAVPYVRYSQGL